MLNLTDHKTIINLLKKHKFNFSKSLGQNFLTDESVPSDIASSANLDESYFVLEIGPGIGTLTAELAKKAKKVLCVEIDKALMPILKETLADFNNIEIINSDILKLQVNKLIEEHSEGLNVAICANLPYYITTPIIMHLLGNNIKAEKLTFMVQKEVALRLCAKPATADYGAITLAVKYYTKPKILFDVPNTSFTPMPKVTSSVIELNVLEKPSVEPKNKDFMFSIIKAAFAQRRKTLVNALCNALPCQIHKEDILEALNVLGKDERIRGETLDLQEFSRLSDLLTEKYGKKLF